MSPAQVETPVDDLRSPEFAKDLQLGTRFVLLLERLADATETVNSPPVATAHHLIDYTAVGRRKKPLDQSSSLHYV